jgi:ribonuclease D
VTSPHVKAHPGLLSTGEQIIELAARLRSAEMIAYDTEFIRESTFFPMVEIIQVATETDSWLVDARAFKTQKGGQEALRPLLDVFEDRSIIKVAHASQGDQECLYTSFGVVAVPTLDTSVAASLCGYGDGIGLGNLLKAVLDVQIKKGHARTNWSVRPLPGQLEEYAHADVEHLVRMGRALLKELDELGRREWAFELSSQWENPALYEPNPAGLAEKLSRSGRLDKRGYSALLELLRWREERVRKLNLPRRWVADDNVLMDLAHVRPKDMEHLSAFRGLNKGELKNSGEAILAALNRASEAKDVALPRIPRPDIPNGHESQVLDLLHCYVGILADRHRIALKHLVTSAQLLPLLRSKAERKEQFVEQGLLTEGAARLIGDEIVAFLQGRRALSIDGTRVRIVDVQARDVQ